MRGQDRARKREMARFFAALTAQDGSIPDVNIEQISSISEEQAAQLAARMTDRFQGLGYPLARNRECERDCSQMKKEVNVTNTC